MTNIEGGFVYTQGNLKIALWGGGVTWTPAKGGGGGLEKWRPVSGRLFCVRTDVGAKGTGTQNLARKIFFHQFFSPHTFEWSKGSARRGYHFEP